jgi:hypothetical protein
MYLTRYSLMLVIAVGACNLVGVAFWWAEVVRIAGIDGDYTLRFALMFIAFIFAPAATEPILDLAVKAEVDHSAVSAVEYTWSVLYGRPNTGRGGR